MSLFSSSGRCEWTVLTGQLVSQRECTIKPFHFEQYSPPGYMVTSLTQLSRIMTQETTHHHTVNIYTSDHSVTTQRDAVAWRSITPPIYPGGLYSGSAQLRIFLSLSTESSQCEMPQSLTCRNILYIILGLCLTRSLGLHVGVITVTTVG